MQPPPTTNAAVADAGPASSAGPFPGTRRFFKAARMLHAREKARLRGEIAQIPGLLALLMKPRNGLKWTQAERRELRVHLRGLSRLSVYLAMAVLPFTSLTLPLLAWWLDMRRNKRA